MHLADYAHQTIELANKLEPSLENKFFMGSAYGFLSRYYIRQGNIWKAYGSSRLERVYLEDVLNQDSDFLSAQADSVEEKYNIRNANTLNRVGYNFINQDRLLEALKIFKLNLKIFPEVANCYDSLAEGYMLMGNNEMAIKYYKMAYEKLPHDETINEPFREFLKTGIEQRLRELGAELNI